MDEATTRHRAPSPPNTRKFVEADARSTDLLPKSSRSHARRPSTNFLQVRDEPEFILHDLAGPYPVQNSPSEPQNANFGPLFACRENFIPHAEPLPVQNSPSTTGSTAHPVQNSPSKPQNADFGPLFACRENFVPLPPPTTRAGRTLSRMRGRFRYKTLPAARLGGPPGTKLSQHARLDHPPGTKLSPQAARRPTRYKTLPASPKTPISAHFSHAGRTFYRFRHQHDKQGEKSHAPTPHRTHQRAPLAWSGFVDRVF